VFRQRAAFGKGNMDETRVQRLNDLGFQWSLKLKKKAARPGATSSNTQPAWSTRTTEEGNYGDEDDEILAAQRPTFFDLDGALVDSASTTYYYPL
jgi:hypothetical protein